MRLGFEYATGPIFQSILRMIIPEEKVKIVNDAYKEVDKDE